MAETHAVLTGPIKGAVTLPDGTEVDVSDAVIYVESPEVAAEVAHQIGMHWKLRGHPDDIEVDEKTGKPVVRPFDYDESHHKKHGRSGKKG
jgi:hypothetical protein